MKSDKDVEKGKEEFVEMMRVKTKKFAVDAFNLCNSLSPGRAYGTVVCQLVKSASSTGANYRAACRARSKKEFFSKMSIVVEEADESLYWLEMIQDLKAPCDQKEVTRLMQEIDEIIRITAKAKNSASN